MVNIFVNAKADKRSILGGVPKHHLLDINLKKYIEIASFPSLLKIIKLTITHQLSTHTKTLVSTDSTKPPLSLCTGRTGWLGTSPGATRRGGGNSASM